MDEGQKKLQEKLDKILTGAEQKILELEKRQDVLITHVTDRVRLATIEQLKKNISG